MAKRNKTIKGIEQVNGETKGISKIKMFFYWFIIPFLFALLVLLVIAQIANINIFERAKEITGFSEEQVLTEDKKTDVLEERVVSLQAEIQEKEAQIDKVQSELDSSATEKEALLIEQERLLEEIATLTRNQESAKRDYAEIVSTFEKMSAKTAAPVITKMSDAEALRILTSLKPDTVASIYEKMTPEDAAKYTELMTK